MLPFLYLDQMNGSDWKSRHWDIYGIILLIFFSPATSLTTRAGSVCQGKRRACGTGISINSHLSLSSHQIPVYVQTRCCPSWVAKECCVLTKYQRVDKSGFSTWLILPQIFTLPSKGSLKCAWMFLSFLSWCWHVSSETIIWFIIIL